MTTALVLGAGGATAWVFHTGVLQTLHQQEGLDPSGVDLIVGTSAGATVGAAVRAGVAVDRIFAAATRPPKPDEQQAMLAELRAARKTIRPLSPGLARDVLPGGRGATLALAGLLPPGWFPTTFLAGFPGMTQYEAWPDGLWIPAVRAADGELVVFGRDRTDVPVSVAVEASSAVPGMFRPRMIENVAYIDGGVTSSTHADLLVDSGVDRAFISAPMSKPSRRLFARNARQRLSAEVTALHNAGIETIVVQPSPAAVRAARGFPRRNPEAAPDIVEHAAEATRLALATA
jgi:NTE family protein